MFKKKHKYKKIKIKVQIQKEPDQLKTGQLLPSGQMKGCTRNTAVLVQQ